MNENLINLPTDKLLKKFGAGEHIPGSGSAVAIQGMLSAQLIRTVIELTRNNSQKHNSQEHFAELQEIDSKIEDRIFPSLKSLFEQDANTFDKIIKLRRAAAEENEPIKKNELNANALQELKPATEIPIRLANLCEELADFAAYVFDYGRKAVRGDSIVALNFAVSAVSGCLSIIDLNLLSFDDSNEWTKKIISEKQRLLSNYKNFSLKVTQRRESLTREAEQKHLFNKAIKRVKSKLSYSDIETRVRQLQNTIWKYRNVIWKHDVPDIETDILRPEIVLEKILGFQCKKSTTLGVHEIQGKQINVAGLIDWKNKIVEISQDFSREIQNFTAAHELGHALLHQQNRLHRDRALDGSGTPGHRDLQEWQADKFATYFLMPRKLVESKFEDLFLMKKFKVDEETVFALTAGSVSDFKEKYKELRDFSEFLAVAEYFNGKHFYSISKQFRVSAGAMAIRLEELKLVEF